MTVVEIETFVSRTGEVPGWKQNLASIREMRFSEIPHQHATAGGLDGMIELRVNGTLMLGTEFLGFGYVDVYWLDAMEFVAELMELKSATWDVSGKTAYMYLERFAGTRRGEFRLVICGRVERAVEVHIPTFAEAILEGAAEYFAWLPEVEVRDSINKLNGLRTCAAPWRHAGER